MFNNKGFAPIILLAGALIAILVGVGYYLFQNYLPKPINTLSVINSNPKNKTPIASTNTSSTSSTIKIQPSQLSSFPQFIQNARATYDNGTNVYFLSGLANSPKLIDQGNSPQFSIDHTKIFYVGYVGDKNAVMIYDIASSKKSVFITEDQYTGIEDVSWSADGTYALISEHSGGADVSNGVIYAYPSGKRISSIGGIEGRRAASAWWINDSTIIYTEPLPDTYKGNYNPRCVGAGYANQITKQTFPSAQKQVLFSATQQSDYAMTNLDNSNLYYHKTDWSANDCTTNSNTSDSLWKAKLDGTGSVQVTKADLPSESDKILSLLGPTYSKDSISFVKHNSQDNNWIIFTLNTPYYTTPAGFYFYPSDVVIINLQNPASTFLQLAHGETSIRGSW